MEFLYSLLPISVASLLFFSGFVFCFLPVIPGPLLTIAGMIIHKLWVPESTVSWTFINITSGILVITLILDYVLSYFGAKKFGATWKGAVGAIVGTIAGPILLGAIPFGIFVGLILGPFAGALAGELIAGQDFKAASKSGFGTLLGGFLAFIIKGAACCAIPAAFIMRVY